MAKVTIVIEDSPLGDRVSFVMTPKFQDLAAKTIRTKDGLTSAEGYAMACANLVLNKSKEFEGGKIITKIPRIRRMNG